MLHFQCLRLMIRMRYGIFIVIRIIYFTNITGKRERVTLESEQIGEEIKIKTSFEIEDSELKSWDEDASKVMYLQKG